MSEREQKWLSVVEAWQASVLSGAAFCREQGLVYHQFQYWQRKWGPNNSSDKTSETKQLVPVQLNSVPATDDTSLQLQLPNGIVIRGVTLGNVDTVSQLLTRL